MRYAVLALSPVVIGSCGATEDAQEPNVAGDVDAGLDAEAEPQVASHLDSATPDAAMALVCQTIGRTGPPTSCRMFAYCGHAHFEIDCSAVVSCRCRQPDVDGPDGGARIVPYESIFCESPDSGEPSLSLGVAFDAAARACGWREQH